MVDALNAQDSDNHGRQKVRPRQRAIEMLDRVGIPDPARQIKEYPHQMSGGMRQRVMIAMAIACRPSLLIADEPTSALDPEMVKEVLDTMQDLATEGMTMIVVTHEMGFAREVADRVVFFESGNIVEQNTPQEFFTNPQEERSKLFLSQILTH